ncbi:MAG: EFR1 family ferrodoxin [Candidatus Methanoplasma sp.]|jgi:ferredoxin|nr:EFR1 family ferrodoxin [Candidatus Methanoplasma sp.]
MATIYCFTSTGNSLFAARRIAGEIGAEVVPMTGEAPAANGDGVIGFVFPVFFWGVPNIVRRFVERLEISDPGAYVFAVATYGGAAPGAVGEIRGLLRGAGLSYAASVKTVENYIPKYKAKDSPGLRARTEARLAEVARDVAARETNRAGRHWALNRAFHRLFPGRDPGCDSRFVVSASCTGCGACAEACPVGNISASASGPVFAHGCEHCLSCVHLCPAEAIDWGGSQGKERYVHPDVGAEGIVQFRKGRRG